MVAQAPYDFRRALPWLAFITALFFINFLTRVIFSPLMLSIESELGIHHGHAGRLYLAFSIGYAASLFASGFISTRIRHRTIITISALGVGAAFIAVAFTRTYLELALGLCAFGVTSGLYLPSGVAALTSLVREKDYGKAFSVHELAPNFSLFIAPLLAVLLLDSMDWREVLLLLGSASIAGGVLFHFRGHGGDVTGRPPDLALIRSIVRARQFWGLLLLFCMAVGASFAPYSVMPLYLVDERGLSESWANELLAISRIAGPAGAVLAGWISDRIGPKPTITLSLAACSAATFSLGAAEGGFLVAAVILQAFFSVMYFPAGFSLLSQVFPSDIRSMAISCLIPVAILTGNGLIPSLLGWAGHHGEFDMGFICQGVLMLASLAVIPLLRERLNTV
ncbi:MFS transporter [Oceanidesulfovibrio marinus]|uniref:MFS transporter n=1 Tax=Oceanidesulfovibrio marinus TaxID=370038 RepID=A0A6P1ZI56_9BACT|nr:MFS transporter [Oceanidesulfovibrio marinus]QJT08523.1 MFS transporter [Oceanidesulfovibrio marinus]TVM33009.1 MFS transporter [Oceanidesulfovibrio marinus]